MIKFGEQKLRVFAMKINSLNNQLPKLYEPLYKNKEGREKKVGKKKVKKLVHLPNRNLVQTPRGVRIPPL